ncbi:MAG: hypothetical protein M1826_004179 [Phylliscum demangeonii]|nr:MAG: hypothetical protein M1826_004179 [Phylliscum demangeonii]
MLSQKPTRPDRDSSSVLTSSAEASTTSTMRLSAPPIVRKSVQEPSYFQRRTVTPRPASDATEMFDTDVEEDEDRDAAMDSPPRNSPRSSINSTGQSSLTTVSSYDEAITPISNHFAAFDVRDLRSKPVEGPRGPHLFRASQDSSAAFHFHLSMSPLTPNEPSRLDLPAPPARPPRPRHRHAASAPVETAIEPDAAAADIRQWSPSEVARWMYRAGFDEAVVDRFQRNDISGAILVDLKFEDLKELDIQSFGKRHRLWSEIQRLRGSPLSSPVDESAAFGPEEGDASARASPVDCLSPVGDEGGDVRRRGPRKPRRRRTADEAVVSPADSVSIVGIEQLIPKLHRCSKGERCAKYRRQQHQWNLLAHEHALGPDHAGQIVITGDAGNALTAHSLLRPGSEAVPSVVASSDVLGPEPRPTVQLQEEHLRVIEARDPQENVKQFLTFQHVRPAASPPAPASPVAYEMFPGLGSPAGWPSVSEHLRSLPRLTIPTTADVRVGSPTHTVVPAARIDRFGTPASAVMDVPPASRIDRFGTPASAMDVPVTAVPVGPVARDVSQSVPPDMRYRRGSVSGGPGHGHARRDSWQPSYHISRVEEDVQLEASLAHDGTASTTAAAAMMMMGRSASTRPPRTIKDVSHAGWMKKRKTRFLRHEWHEHHFTLRGTSLAMRPDPRSSKVLEEIDVDDYAIACSSLASNSKLSAAFKAMRLTGRRDFDGTAFAFQLVPAADKKAALLAGAGAGSGAGGTGPGAGSSKHLAATGKTHYFAVRSRDERIDWMRELMLAKALKQKGEGYQMSLNGHPI